MKTFRLHLIALIALFGFSGCSSLLYQPSPHQFATSDQIQEHFGATPEDVYFPTANGTQIHGWYFKHNGKQKKPKAVLVFFHGNAQNLSTHFVALMWVLDFDYDFMIFDYEGYWLSKGEPSPENTIEDGKAALRYAVQRNPGVPLVVFGQSLGGAVGLRTAIEMKDQVPIKLVVADSTFLSYEAAGAHVLSHHWLTWLFQPLAYLVLSDKYAPDDRVSEISPIPLIVIHGTNDQTIDFDLGKEIYEKSKEPHLFWPVEGGHHIDSMFRDKGKYRKMLLDEMNKIFAQ